MTLNENQINELENDLKILHISEQYATCSNDLTKQTIYNNGSKACSKAFRIIHFNDVYDIEGDEKEKIGGAARFSTAIKLLKEEEPCLVFFSGDAFSPSTCKLSIITNEKSCTILY